MATTKKDKLKKFRVSAIPNTKKSRRKFLAPRLSELVGRSFYCPALRTHVSFTAKSVKETTWNATLSKENTLLAVNVGKLFRRATILANIEVTPGVKSTFSNSLKSFKFKRIYILKSVDRELGTAKIVVGSRSNGQHIEYSVTSLYVRH